MRVDASIAPYTLARPYPIAEESAAGSRQCVLSWILKGALAKRSCASTNPSALEPGCCAVAKQSKPQWGFEAHERARFAGWRRSLCAAKRALSEVAGPFSVPFGVPKGTLKKRLLFKRGIGRKVPGDGSRALKAGCPRTGAAIFPQGGGHRKPPVKSSVPAAARQKNIKSY